MSKRFCTYHQRKLEAFGFNLRSILDAPELPIEAWIVIYNHVATYIDKVHMKLACKTFYYALPVCYRPPPKLSTLMTKRPYPYETCWHHRYANHGIPYACDRCTARVRGIMKTYKMDQSAPIFTAGLPLAFYPTITLGDAARDGFSVQIDLVYYE